MIERRADVVVVTADDGTRKEWSIAAFEANAAACIAATGNGIKPPVPETVSSAQARVALYAAGLLPTIEAIVADEATPVPVKIFWEYEVSFWRESPAINSLAQVAGLTQDQLDDLFRAAAAIIV